MHPLFKDQDQGKDTKEMINQIKNYKPQTSYLEIKLNKSKGGEINEEYLRSLSKFKKIENNKKKEKNNNDNHINDNDNDNFNDINQDKINENNSNNIKLSKKRQRAFNINGNEKIIKQIKKSNISDFKHPTQYITSQPTPMYQSNNVIFHF